MKRIALVTPAHLATNPRLVKEADALAEAGYLVDVYACQWMDWAITGDEELLSGARWRAHLLRWGQAQDRFLFWKSRLRQHACRKLLPATGPGRFEPISLRAYDRVLPELRRMALTQPADLFIAHNLQALPIAYAAAKRHGAKLGFDAEDFHSGMVNHNTPLTPLDKVTEHWERTYLTQCDYVTAAAPGIAESYAEKLGVPLPTVVLNVFPLADRPSCLRPLDRSTPLTLYWFSQAIGPTRGLEDVIRALGIAGEPGITLHLRGVWVSGYRDHLLALAASSGVDPERIIAHPPGPPGEMVRLSAAYDVGLALEQNVSLNRDICLTNKIFTYLLAGNAVIATATSGQRRVVETLGDAGAAYEPGDVQALAGWLRHWARDGDSLEAARRRAWGWGATRYNWDVEKNTFLSVVARVLESRDRVAA